MLQPRHHGPVALVAHALEDAAQVLRGGVGAERPGRVGVPHEEAAVGHVL